MLDPGFVMLLAAWSAGVGLWLLGRWKAVPEHPSDALALAVPLGLGTLALATLGLGECGVMDRTGMLVVLGIGALIGLDGWRIVLKTPGPPGPEAEPPVVRGRSKLDAAVALLALAGIVGSLLTALAPTTDGDALCYHLQVPKVFLWRGSVGFDPDLHETIYPLLTEMLYAVALAFRGPVACRLIQWLLGLVFAANVTALARPSLGRRAWWAGAIAVLVPAVSNGMSAPLNDVALAAFGTAALAAWVRYQDAPSRSSARVAGVFAGLALGVKYPALVLAALLAKTIAARSLPGFRLSPWGRWAGVSKTVIPQQRPGRIAGWAHALAFSLAALVAGGCWYARAWVHTGNPVYPFFRDSFGGAGLAEVLDPIKRPLETNLWGLLTALGPLTLEPDKFDSFSHQFGPIFLLFVPALFLERAPRRVLALTALGYLFLVLCLTQRQSMRFVLTAVGPLSVAAAWLANAWWERRSVAGRLLVTLLLGCLGFEATLAVARARHGLPVVLGAESADAYLSRREPTYQVGRWMAAHLPEAARLVGQDHRGFYLPRDYTMELAHRRRTGLGRQGESARAVVAALRRDGFSHVLLCPPVPETAVEFDPTLGRLLAAWLAGRAPVYRQDLADADGVVRRYALYDLTEVVAQGEGQGGAVR